MQIPRLQLGSRGSEVERLQRLLNSRLYGAAFLKVDGWFGERTRRAILEFQRKSHLVPDAVVGRKTWFQLLSAPVAKASPALPQKVATRTPVTTAAVPTAATLAPTPVTQASEPASKPASDSIDQWSLEQRFRYVLQRTGSHLGPELRTQFEGLLTATNLGILVGTLVVWAGGHFFGVSEVTDAFLLGFGLVFLGKAAIDAARLLKNFIELTCTASTRRGLEEAAKDLAQAISIIGVVAFFALLAKVGRALGRGSKAPGGGSAAPPEEDVPAARSKAEAQPSEQPEEQRPGPKKPIAAALENSEFNGVKADRVRPGTNGKVAVIGRSMGKAVNPYAKGLAGEGSNVETFEPSQTAKDEWQDLAADYPSGRIPDDIIPDTKMYRENQAWAQKLSDQEYTVVDVDNPAGQPPSPFYEMEKQTLFSDTPDGGKR